MRTKFNLRIIVLTSLLLIHQSGALGREPTRLIFDTDMGNDVDDALALGVIHALEDQGECKLLAVTITKDHELCAPYIDAVNTFYGRPSIPIGVVRNGPTKNDSRFLPLAREQQNGSLRYPHDLLSGKEAEDATAVLRRTLAQQPDHSVVIAQVGFSTNLARLLKSKPDEHSPMNGRELVGAKVRLLSIMAGAFELINGKIHREYNVAIDIPPARQLTKDWPTPVVFSGYEIGYAICYPASSIESDFDYVDHHPLPESYQLYKPTPHERPCWDLTSVLYAVRPDGGYFDVSPAGKVTVNDDGSTEFEARAEGRHRYLLVDADQIVKTKSALVELATQRPQRLVPQE
ncbi:nucleoside hydrolase [Pirellulales bacterium]|nr:nucleoside hydrolase [Pirellulales bacterium]